MLLNVILLAVALIVGIILAARFLRNAEDPRLAKVENMLPGDNCGSCGESSCVVLATKIVSGQVKPGQCATSTPEQVKAIADYLGVDPGLEDRPAKKR